MRPDCILQQLARGCISFSHLQQEGKENGCNNPLKPANISHKPSLCFWVIKTLSFHSSPCQIPKNWPGRNVNETNQMESTDLQGMAKLLAPYEQLYCAS